MFIGVGEVATLAMVVMGVYFVGQEVLTFIDSLKAFIETVSKAKTEAELNQTARYFADTVQAGIEIARALFTRGKGGQGVVRMKSKGGSGSGDGHQLGATAGSGTSAGGGGKKAPKNQPNQPNKQDNSNSHQPPADKTKSDGDLVYSPTANHRKGGWRTEMDLDDKTAREVLNGSIAGGKQRYGYHNGKLYEFQPDNAGGYHGYPVPGNEVPTHVLREMRDRGTITNSEYNKIKKGKHEHTEIDV